MIDLLAITRWTSANLRAARDYHDRPHSACPRANCDQLANGQVCVGHERDNAASRRRKKRAA